mgnify:CR=1 FL=1
MLDRPHTKSIYNRLVKRLATAGFAGPKLWKEWEDFIYDAEDKWVDYEEKVRAREAKRKERIQRANEEWRKHQQEIAQRQNQYKKEADEWKVVFDSITEVDDILPSRYADLLSPNDAIRFPSFIRQIRSSGFDRIGTTGQKFLRSMKGVQNFQDHYQLGGKGEPHYEAVKTLGRLQESEFVENHEKSVIRGIRVSLLGQTTLSPEMKNFLEGLKHRFGLELEF